MTIGRSAFLAVAALTAFLMSMPAWQWVAGWSGSGIKETETFSVQSEWRITWETKNEKKEGAGIFQIYVHDENDKLVSLAANKQGVGKDTSYVRSAGKHYLKINSGNVDWTVLVEDLQ